MGWRATLVFHEFRSIFPRFCHSRGVHSVRLPMLKDWHFDVSGFYLQYLLPCSIVDSIVCWKEEVSRSGVESKVHFSILQEARYEIILLLVRRVKQNTIAFKCPEFKRKSSPKNNNACFIQIKVLLENQYITQILSFYNGPIARSTKYQKTWVCRFIKPNVT